MRRNSLFLSVALIVMIFCLLVYRQLMRIESEIHLIHPTTNGVAYVATLEIIDINGNTNHFTWGSQPKP